MQNNHTDAEKSLEKLFELVAYGNLEQKEFDMIVKMLESGAVDTSAWEKLPDKLLSGELKYKVTEPCIDEIRKQ